MPAEYRTTETKEESTLCVSAELKGNIAEI